MHQDPGSSPARGARGDDQLRNPTSTICPGEPPRTAFSAGGALPPVATDPELLDESEMGGLPAELDASPGRLGALVEEEYVGEVLTETRACLGL